MQRGMKESYMRKPPIRPHYSKFEAVWYFWVCSLCSGYVRSMMVMYGKLGEGYMEYSILFLYFFVSLKLLENRA